MVSIRGVISLRTSLLIVATLLTAAAAAPALAATGGPPTAATAGKTNATVVVHVRPTTAGGHKLPRYRVVRILDGYDCEPFSEVVGGAYRCFGPKYVIDPCWLQNTEPIQALCIGSPWEKTVWRLHLNKLGGHPSAASNSIWGLRLANWNRCTALQGAGRPSVHGRYLIWMCSHRTGVVQGLNRTHRTWRARTITEDSSGHWHWGPLRDVARAYVGLRSWYPNR
jgi:hypothetical protein